jgi:hypothetical protein
MHHDPDDYQNWWENVWSERHELFKSVYGETSPPGWVISFTWSDFDLMTPGGCAMVFPPLMPGRPDWMTISHGLSQPSEPSQSSPNKLGPSGYGYEFGLQTRAKESWCPKALYQLLTYTRQSCKPIERGHRVPMWFSKTEDGNTGSCLGQVQEEHFSKVFGDMRALLFWPDMRHPRGFETSTGYFSILVGTSITQAEWDLAKTTSSSHLLLMLFEAGIGQVSDLERETVTSDKKWQDRWVQIRELTQKDADQKLLEYSCC